MAHPSALTRRALLGGAGLAAAAGTVAAWPRLTGTDIPGRGDDALTVLILGTAQDAAGRQVIADAFMEAHPDIPVRIQSVQATDWGDFFAKILTMVASGTQPDIVYTATEGAQLFAERLALPLDDYLLRDADAMRDYFDDVHPSLIEAFMYKGSLYQLPLDFNAANMYLNLDVLERNGLEMPGEEWTRDDFTELLREMQGDSTPYYWTNRLFGGVVPWLYVNDTSFLVEERAEGGEEFWSRFYPGQERSGGYLWTGSNATGERVHETFGSSSSRASPSALSRAAGTPSSVCSRPAASAPHRPAATGSRASLRAGCARSSTTCSSSRSGARSATSSGARATRS